MTYHLAQLNIARMKAPLDSPVMADFVANLARINGLAEASPATFGGCRTSRAMPPRCVRSAMTWW